MFSTRNRRTSSTQPQMQPPQAQQPQAQQPHLKNADVPATNGAETNGADTNDVQTNDVQTNDVQTNDVQTNGLEVGHVELTQAAPATVAVEAPSSTRSARAGVLPSRLGRLRQRFPRRSTLMLYVSVMGPGLIAALAGNDAGGIGTYSFAGARYGYSLLWLLFVITFVLALVQEMAARMGAVTQKGLGELIREHYGVSWTLFALGVMFIANVATTISEFAGIAAAGELFGLSKGFTVPFAAIVMWLVVARGPFRLVERIFLAICLVQATYIVAAFRAVHLHPPPGGWNHILTQLVRPSWQHDTEFILLCIGLIGTTITPYMQFFLQSTIVDKGIHVGEYRYQKADVYAGVLVTNIVAFFIIVCTAATIYASGIKVDADTFDAKTAALALSQPLGQIGVWLFAAGLLAASLLAAAVLPLTTAYTYCEAFGWEIGVQKSWKEAPVFYGFFTVTLGLAALFVLFPRVPLFAVMLISQDVNGILLPVVLVFMLKLVNTRRIMGEHVNGRAQNLVAWTAVILLIALTLILLVSSLWGLIHG